MTTVRIVDTSTHVSVAERPIYVRIAPAIIPSASGSGGPATTDALPEGATNLYHTSGRAAAAAPVQSVNGLTGAVTVASTPLSDVAAQALGTAAAGVGADASREDHVHPMPSAADVGAEVAGAVATHVALADPLALADDQRRIEIDQTATNALGATTALDFLRAHGVDTSAWPGPILGALAQCSLYAQIASAAYGAIKSLPPLVTPAVPDQVDPATGEVIPGSGSPEIVTPSEFADAIDV